MPNINAEIPDALFKSLSEYLSKNQSHSLDQLVTDAIRMYLESSSNILYQISTSNALVEGIYRGAISVETLLQHGDLGLGTFENLDGEMIVVDGAVFQAHSDGSVTSVNVDATTPFAVVTHFAPTSQQQGDYQSFKDLESAFDLMRDSDNLFYALRVTGVFERIHLRAMCKTEEGVPLVEAAAVQPEFYYENLTGTLVGFWSPKYAKTLNVPGYHFHFLSKEHSKGGHVLGCSGNGLHLELQREVAFTTVLPENDEFLHADLTHDSSADLEKSESSQNNKN